MEKEQRYFPFFVDISEYRVLVVGAGIIALRRTSALLRFGTRVTVVAPDIRAEFQALQHSMDRNMSACSRKNLHRV